MRHSRTNAVPHQDDGDVLRSGPEPRELVTNADLRRLARGDAGRQRGVLSREDQTFLAMALPDLCGEMLGHRYAAQAAAGMDRNTQAPEGAGAVSPATIIARYAELEAAADETLGGPDYDALAEDVAEDLGLPVATVLDVMIKAWLDRRAG